MTVICKHRLCSVLIVLSIIASLLCAADPVFSIGNKESIPVLPQVLISLASCGAAFGSKSSSARYMPYEVQLQEASGNSPLNKITISIPCSNYIGLFPNFAVFASLHIISFMHDKDGQK